MEEEECRRREGEAEVQPWKFKRKVTEKEVSVLEQYKLVSRAVCHCLEASGGRGRMAMGEEGEEKEEEEDKKGGGDQSTISVSNAGGVFSCVSVNMIYLCYFSHHYIPRLRPPSHTQILIPSQKYNVDLYIHICRLLHTIPYHSLLYNT